MTNTMPNSPSSVSPLSAESITRWVDGYLRAWRSNDAADIAILFAENAEYHEQPFDTDWIGRDEIIEGWRGRWDWQQGGWEFEFSITGIDRTTAVITGIGHYAKLGDFDNVWTVQFDQSGRCSRFDMLNTERM